MGTEYRVGHAFDVHARSDDPQRPLVLGGVAFPGERGLVGHSDADIVAHVCADALLSASGLPDIGQMFPDTNPDMADVRSLELLKRAAEALRANGWELGNIACTVVLDTPRLADAKNEMQSNLAEASGGLVTVSGRRTEGIGSLGRGEGIAAWAVALVAR